MRWWIGPKTIRQIPYRPSHIECLLSINFEQYKTTIPNQGIQESQCMTNRTHHVIMTPSSRSPESRQRAILAPDRTVHPKTVVPALCPVRSTCSPRGHRKPSGVPLQIITSQHRDIRQRLSHLDKLNKHLKLNSHATAGRFIYIDKS